MTISTSSRWACPAPPESQDAVEVTGEFVRTGGFVRTGDGDWPYASGVSLKTQAEHEPIRLVPYHR